MKTTFFGIALGTIAVLAWVGCGAEESANGPALDGGSLTSDAATDEADGSTVTPGTDGGGDDDSSTPATPDAGGDATPPAEDAGPLEFDAGITAPPADVQYGSCSAFTPCASDPTGTWEFASGGCVDALKNDFCADAKITDIKAQGTVSYDGTNYTQEAATTGTVSVPGSCLDSLPIKSCALVEIGLTTPPPKGLGFDAAKCANDGTGGCSCNVGKKDSRKGTYTIENGTTIRTDEGRTYDMCVKPATTLTYRDTTKDTAIPATMVLTKKP